MALSARSHSPRAVIAGVAITGVFITDTRPTRGAGMTRGARRNGRDKVSRRFCRGNMSNIATIVLAIMADLTPFKSNH